MDFSAIFQSRSKKFWWMDAMFYFAISLLIATVLCYLIFLVKNDIQREDIKKESIALEVVGTDQQKEYEKKVIEYQKKVADFTGLLKNHEFASNVFAFMQAETMPNIWFKQFNLDKKNKIVQLSGEADSLDSFSRQVANFEENKYVKSVTTLNSSLESSDRIGFNVNLVLDQSIFDYIVSIVPVVEELDGEPLQPVESVPNENLPIVEEQIIEQKNEEKLIVSFHLLLNPEVVGTIDEKNHTINLEVPQNIDLKNIATSIIISSGATISPETGVFQNFENPVDYTVTAEDGSTQNYKAQVVLPEQEPVSPANVNSVQYVYVLAIVVILIIASILIFIILKKRSRNKNNLTNNV